jgi:hypothetical protein
MRGPIASKRRYLIASNRHRKRRPLCGYAAEGMHLAGKEYNMWQGVSSTLAANA